LKEGNYLILNFFAQVQKTILTKTHNFDIRKNKPLKVSKIVIHFNLVFLGFFLGHNILLTNPHDYKNMFSYLVATIYSKNQDITRP
jgi:hypothetical protein